MIKIFIDPGHGGKDNGAQGHGMLEKDINLGVALKVKKNLQRHGIKVAISRETDKYVSLLERAKMANVFGAKYFISIHHNAGGGDGAETIHSIVHGKGEALAGNIMDEFTAIGQNCRRVFSKEGSNGDYYSVVRNTKMPAVITEFGFMDTDDAEIFDTEQERESEAIAITKGILKQCGIAYVPPVVKAKYAVQIGAFASKENANKLLAEAKAKGFNGFIKEV